MGKYLYILVVSILIIACNDQSGADSPYNDLLRTPPYDQITDSISDDPKNDELYFRRAVLLNKNNQPLPALSDFRKAWELQPSEKYAFGVTNALLEKQPDSALIFLDVALAQFPQSFLLQLTKARALSETNRIDDALRVCDSILKMTPDVPEVLQLQSDLYERKGDVKQSTIALEKAYFLAPDLTRAYQLAFNYAETKSIRTLAFCDSLIAADTQKLHSEPIFVKGIYYSNIGDKAKAIALFDETIKRDYNFLDAYIEKGRILLDQKKTRDALQTFELANTIRPSFPDAWFWMGKCQELLGDIEEAKLSYQKAYSLDKSFVEAKEAGERL